MNKLKITILALMTYVGANQITAQETSFGAKAGINYSSLSGENNNSNGLGFHLGGLMDLGLSDALNFRIELLASSRRMSFSESEEFFGVETKITGSSNPLYLALPIMYKYDINDKISLMVGPQISFLVSNSYKSKATIDGNILYDEKLSGSDAKTGLRSSEIGLALGGEFNLSEKAGIGLRYVRGLQTYTDLDSAEDNFNVIQASFIYKF